MATQAATIEMLRNAFLAWWHQGSDEEDEVIAEEKDLLLDGLSDADRETTKGDPNRNRDGEVTRDNTTIEDAEDMHEERVLRRWPKWLRN